MVLSTAAMHGTHELYGQLHLIRLMSYGSQHQIVKPKTCYSKLFVKLFFIIQIFKNILMLNEVLVFQTNS